MEININTTLRLHGNIHDPRYYAMMFVGEPYHSEVSNWHWSIANVSRYAVPSTKMIVPGYQVYMIHINDIEFGAYMPNHEICVMEVISKQIYDAVMKEFYDDIKNDMILILLPEVQKERDLVRDAALMFIGCILFHLFVAWMFSPKVV